MSYDEDHVTSYRIRFILERAHEMILKLVRPSEFLFEIYCFSYQHHTTRFAEEAVVPTRCQAHRLETLGEMQRDDILIVGR